MNADKDRADGYKRGQSYLCRHCEKLITIHNGHWAHCDGDWMYDDCGKKFPGKYAQPVPCEVRCDRCAKHVALRSDGPYEGYGCQCVDTHGMKGTHRQVVPCGIVMPGSEEKVNMKTNVPRRTICEKVTKH